MDSLDSPSEAVIRVTAQNEQHCGSPTITVTGTGLVLAVQSATLEKFANKLQIKYIAHDC